MNIVNQIVTDPKSNLAKDAKQKLNDIVVKIDSELESYFAGEIANPFGNSDKEKELSITLWKHIKEHNLRPAKRLRASFIYYGYKLLGGEDDQNIIKACLSIELIHTALLMHDDFMDADDIRRGLPTTHKFFEALHQQKNYQSDPVHFGTSMAICTGDLALCAGFELLAQTDFDPVPKNLALSKVLRGIANTALGQAYDIVLESSHQATEQDILDLHFAKTAIYTYENPLHIGAILAGANKKDLEILSEYSIPGGIAFQLQDDILGLFGDSQKTGKSSFSDIKQGKMTLLIIYALEHANQLQKQLLKSLWGNKNLTPTQAQQVRDIIKETGSLEHSKEISTQYAKKSQESISKMEKNNWNSESINYLNGIAQYLIEREM